MANVNLALVQFDEFGGAVACGIFQHERNIASKTNRRKGYFQKDFHNFLLTICAPLLVSSYAQPY